jgi:hypothetical protein
MEAFDKALKCGGTEAFGMDFANQSLPDILITCASCITLKIESTTSFAEAMRLSIVKLRLTRWAEAVDLFSDPALDEYEPSLEELSLANKALVRIIALFDSSAAFDDVTPAESMRDLVKNEKSQCLFGVLGAISSERLLKGGRSLVPSPPLETSEWSNKRIWTAARCVGTLERLFGSAGLRELCSSEQLRLGSREAVDLLTTVAGSPCDIDPWIGQMHMAAPPPPVGRNMGLMYRSVGGAPGRNNGRRHLLGW